MLSLLPRSKAIAALHAVAALLVLLKSASVLRIALGALETNALPAIESSHHGEASSAPATRASPRVATSAATRTKTEAPGQGRSTNDRGTYKQST